MAISLVSWLLRRTAGECLRVSILQGVKENPCLIHRSMATTLAVALLGAPRFPQTLTAPSAFCLSPGMQRHLIVLLKRCQSDSGQQGEPKQHKVGWNIPQFHPEGCQSFQCWSERVDFTLSELILNSFYLKVDVEQETKSIFKSPNSWHCSSNSRWYMRFRPDTGAWNISLWTNGKCLLQNHK